MGENDQRACANQVPNTVNPTVIVVPGNSAAINDLPTGRQEDGVCHQCRHDGVEVLVRHFCQNLIFLLLLLGQFVHLLRYALQVRQVHASSDTNWTGQAYY